MDGIKDLILSQKENPSEMSREDLEIEATFWRLAIGCLPSEIIDYICAWGQLVAVAQRNYERVLGTLIGAQFQLKNLTISTVEKSFSLERGQYFMERKDVTIPFSNMTRFELIHERDEWYNAEREAEEAQSNLG